MCNFSQRSKLFLLLFVSGVIYCLIVATFHRVLIRKVLRDGIRYYKTSEEASRYNQQCNSTDCLNVVFWDQSVCRRTFENLIDFPKYPYYPNGYYCTGNLTSVVEKTERATIKLIQTKFGPIDSGFYKFRVRSSVPLRLFLGTGTKSTYLSLVLESSGEDTIVYSESYFIESRYYFQMVSFCQQGENHFSIDWLVPGTTYFRPILPRELIAEGHVILPEHDLSLPRGKLDSFPPTEHSLLGFIPRRHVTQSFPACSKTTVEALKNVTGDLSVYTPSSPPNAYVREVLQFIMDGLQQTAPGKYPSYNITKVESTENSSGHPGRLLVDIDLTVDGLDYIERLSGYFLASYHGNRLELCRPLQYRWNHVITVNFVFLADCHDDETSFWANYFIQNMAEVFQTTLDVNLKVIITTCHERESQMYDFSLRSSGFDRYAVVLLEGEYSKSRGLMAGLSVVEEYKSIVVLCESRVKMPTTITEEVRKHTFRSTMAYSPVLFQLDCGYFPNSGTVKGRWCPQCRSVLSLYKEDWEILFASDNAQSNDASNAEGFLKDKGKLLRRLSVTGIEIIEVKLNDMYRL